MRTLACCYLYYVVVKALCWNMKYFVHKNAFIANNIKILRSNINKCHKIFVCVNLPPAQRVRAINTITNFNLIRNYCHPTAHGFEIRYKIIIKCFTVENDLVGDSHTFYLNPYLWNFRRENFILLWYSWELRRLSLYTSLRPSKPKK